MAKLLSLNVGRPRAFDYDGHQVESAIWKLPVAGRVVARGINLEGDAQADRKVHGGRDKATYAYAIEDYRWWETELGRPLVPGEFGENLTTEGIDVTRALVGERWKVGHAEFEVSEPRVPCWRLGARMRDKLFPRAFTKAGRPGTYLRIVTEGDLGAGDTIEIVHRPDDSMAIGDIFRIFTRDRREAPRLLTVPRLSEAWKAWAVRHMDDASQSEA